MRNFERKYRRIKSATQLKPICTRAFPNMEFPMGTEIILDKKRATVEKNHQLSWCGKDSILPRLHSMVQGISHEELFELAEKGFIELEYV